MQELVRDIVSLISRFLNTIYLRRDLSKRDLSQVDCALSVGKQDLTPSFMSFLIANY